MAHGIMENDMVTLYKNAAWHSLGNIISDKLDAKKAFAKSGLDWKVKMSDVETATVDGKKYSQAEFLTLWRTGDKPSVMGNFSKKYKPIQNETIFDLGQEIIELAGKDNLYMESCGSIFNGRRIWLLLDQERIAVNGSHDELHKYVCIANSHDGSLQLGVKPTSIRVVCNNTLSLAFNSKKGNYISIAHKGNIENKIEAAKIILKQYYDLSAKFDQGIIDLSKKKISNASAKKIIEQYWQKVKPGLKDYEDLVQESVETYEREIEELHYKDLNLWLVSNSVTNILQAPSTVNRTMQEDKVKMSENHQYNNLFGYKSDLTDKIFADAFKMVA